MWHTTTNMNTIYYIRIPYMTTTDALLTYPQCTAPYKIITPSPEGSPNREPYLGLNHLLYSEPFSTHLTVSGWHLSLNALHSSLVCKQFGHIILVWYPCGMKSKHSWLTLIIFNPTIDILFFLHSYSLIWESIQLGKFIQLRLGHMIILYPFDF